MRRRGWFTDDRSYRWRRCGMVRGNGAIGCGARGYWAWLAPPAGSRRWLVIFVFVARAVPPRPQLWVGTHPSAVPATKHDTRRRGRQWRFVKRVPVGYSVPGTSHGQARRRAQHIPAIHAVDKGVHRFHPCHWCRDNAGEGVEDAGVDAGVYWREGRGLGVLGGGAGQSEARHVS